MKKERTDIGVKSSPSTGPIKKMVSVQITHATAYSWLFYPNLLPPPPHKSVIFILKINGEHSLSPYGTHPPLPQKDNDE